MNAHARWILLLIGALLTLSLAYGQKSDSAETLLQSGIKKEIVDGDLKGAIELYKQAAARGGSNRLVTAQALLQMGKAYEKLGAAEAKDAYSRVLREYADQQEVAAQAKTRLEALSLGSGGAGAAASARSGPVSRQVWAGPEAEIRGAPSPDGRYFAFFMKWTGDLGLRDLARGENRNLTNNKGSNGSWEFAYNPVFSRDSRQIAYYWENRQGYGELRVINVDGTGSRILYSEKVWVTPYDWSPDGKKVLCTMQDDKSEIEIIEFAVAEGSLRKVKKIGKQAPNQMEYSFDGGYIVYDGLRATNNQDIIALTVTGGQEVPWVDHPATDANPMFTPDGKGLLFTSNRTGNQALWLQPISDGVPQGPPQLLKSDLGSRARPLRITSAGKLFYGVANVATDVSVAEVDPATGKVLAPPKILARSKPGRAVMPKWSPDGKSLVFVGSTDDPRQGHIVVHSVPEGVERELSPPLTGGILWPRWLPDGQSIMFCGSDQDNPGRIFGIEAETGKLTTLARRQSQDGYSINCWHPSSSSDGRKIYYGRFLAERTYLVELELASGTEKVIYRDDATDDWAPLASPDGRWIAFRSGDPRTSSSALKVMPSSGGEAKDLVRLADPEVVHLFTWTPDSSGLLYSRYKGSRSEMMELWIVPVTGGNARKLDLLIGITNTLSIHPDGRRIVFDGRTGGMELWVMENFLPQGAARQAK